MDEIAREEANLLSSRAHVFGNIADALRGKFGTSRVIEDVDVLNNSYLIYVGTVTVEVTFNEDEAFNGR
jgi:hypothetical protein